MKILYIGTVEFSEKVLKKSINLGADIAGVVTKKKSSFNTDFVDLSGIAKRYKIPYRYCAGDINSDENAKWIKKIRPDVIFCFGLSQRLKKRILHSAPMGVIGFHPAKLPQNRGRHPIVWALVLGLRKTASTFFFMKEDIDNGDILNQKEVRIYISGLLENKS